MRVYLLIVFLITPIFTYAQETCDKYRDSSYQAVDKTQINLKSSLYSDIPSLNKLAQMDYKTDIIEKLSEPNQMYNIKVMCADDMSIFFSVYIGDLKVALMNGVIVIESGRYFSGPHSLVNPEDKVVIIQADKN